MLAAWDLAKVMSDVNYLSYAGRMGFGKGHVRCRIISATLAAWDLAKVMSDVELSRLRWPHGI